MAIDNGTEALELRGMDAVRASAVLLPRLNPSGGSKAEVARAVTYLEESSDPVQLFERAASSIVPSRRDDVFGRKRQLLTRLPTAARFALEMASHEEAERRALEGELHVLEAAWQDAEEIAGISDDLLLPESVSDNLARLKGRRGER